MSDYKRFISYMYIYKKGLKGNNIGYAKIESKNGTCKFIVSIKYRELKDHEWNVALFYRGEGEKNRKDINLINIESVNCDKDELMVTYNTKEDNLFDSNIALNRIAGIILVGKNNDYIGTEWDDNGIEYKFISENVKENYNIDDNKENTISKNIGNDYVENDAREDKKEHIVLKEKIDKIQEHKIENKGKKIDDNKKDITRGEEIDINNKVDNNEDVEKADIMNFNKFNESRITNNKIEKTLGSQTQEQIKPYIKRILDGYPGMYPFEDDEVIDCIKLEPHDIGVFPMDKWPLANNSFLLHGYYTYRHLIFARLKRNNKIHYILGVPGIFRDREKFMAKMFGFNNFKGVRNKPLNIGEFGYWYMYLNV